MGHINIRKRGVSQSGMRCSCGNEYGCADCGKWQHSISAAMGAEFRAESAKAENLYLKQVAKTIRESL